MSSRTAEAAAEADAHIQEDLLALLGTDGDGGPPPPSRPSRRGGGRGRRLRSSSPPPTVRNKKNDLLLPSPAAVAYRRSVGIGEGGGGDRSVPPALKDWEGAERRRDSKSSYSSGNGRNGRSGNSGRARRGATDVEVEGGSSSSSSSGDLLRYVALAFTGACAFLYKKTSHSPPSSNNFDGGGGGGGYLPSSTRGGHNGRSSAAATVAVVPRRARFDFIDPAWRGMEEVQFETLIPPSDVDFAIQRRLGAEEERNCDDILLYVSRTGNTNKRNSGGRGKQRLQQRQERGIDLNGYLLAALLATYMGKAMVVIEPPPASFSDSGSWLDCPASTFFQRDASEKKEERNGASRSDDDDDVPPPGLSRVLRHPAWLSRGCPVPCRSTYDFAKWDGLRRQHVRQVTCQNDNDRQAVVFVVDGEDARRDFEERWRERMRARRNAAQAGAYATAMRDWAVRLGAKGHEARAFAGLEREGDVWDYVSALVARSGIVRFRPWIARDARGVIEKSGLPLDRPYVAVYVHRSEDERAAAIDSEENADGDGEGSKFAPFLSYLDRWGQDEDCDVDVARHVYVATNDPRGIREEIDRLPKDAGGNVVLRDCHRLEFVFGGPVESSTTANGPPSSENGRDAVDDDPCSAAHRAEVAALVDLMVLARSDTFVGEFRSNFGRLVRVFRTAVNNFPGRGEDGPVLVRNTRFTLGADTRQGAPGMY